MGELITMLFVGQPQLHRVCQILALDSVKTKAKKEEETKTEGKLPRKTGKGVKKIKKKKQIIFSNYKVAYFSNQWRLGKSNLNHMV